MVVEVTVDGVEEVVVRRHWKQSTVSKNESEVFILTVFGSGLLLWNVDTDTD